MKKSLAFLLLVSASLFILTGCGQDLNVTILNRSGISNHGYSWISIHAHTERFNKTLIPDGYAASDEDITPGNSYSFKAKENDTLQVNANGQTAEVDSDGNVTYTDFVVETQSATLFGGFPDSPDWFAAVYLNEVIIYRK